MKLPIGAIIAMLLFVFVSELPPVVYSSFSIKKSFTIILVPAQIMELNNIFYFIVSVLRLYFSTSSYRAYKTILS